MIKEFTYSSEVVTSKKNWIEPNIEIIGKDIIKIGIAGPGGEGVKTPGSILTYSS